MQNRAFLILSLNWTLLKARFDGEKLTLQHWHGQTPRLGERERRQNFERVCKFDFMPSAAASVCMHVCAAAPWCPCTLHTYMHICTREFANVVGHVCVSLYTWVCLSAFVCECLTAITHVALLRLVTESTFVREQRQQQREIRHKTPVLFFRFSLFFFV